MQFMELNVLLEWHLEHLFIHGTYIHLLATLMALTCLNNKLGQYNICIINI